MNKAYVLIPNNLYLINRSISLKLVSEVLFRCGIGQITDKDVSSSLLVLYSAEDGCGKLTSFAPSDLELLTVKSELFDQSICVEGSGSRPIEERDKDAGSLREKSDVLDRAESD